MSNTATVQTTPVPQAARGDRFYRVREKRSGRVVRTTDYYPTAYALARRKRTQLVIDVFYANASEEFIQTINLNDDRRKRHI